MRIVSGAQGINCHFSPVHQMPSDVSPCHPDPAAQICTSVTAVTLFPSRELSHLFPQLHLISHQPLKDKPVQMPLSNLLIVMFLIAIAFELFFICILFLEPVSYLHHPSYLLGLFPCLVPAILNTSSVWTVWTCQPCL